MAAPPALSAPSQRAAVVDATQIGEARRLAGATCRATGLDEELSSRAAIVVTEAATNVVRHGGGGEVLTRPLEAGGARGLEVIALDQGPGIADVARALEDGHSTGGTPGTGLGAIRRLSTVFDLYAVPGHGTAVLSQLWTVPPPQPLHGAVCLPKPGESECGDVWALFRAGAGWRVIVADGLGHGPDARKAAECVAQGLGGAQGAIAESLMTAHLAARSTRGAAAAVAEVCTAAGEVSFGGVGNVAAVLASPDASRNMVSVNGTLGQGIVRPRQFSYRPAADAVLVLYSDGLLSRWSLGAYPGLLSRHPALVAAVLYRDHRRGHDDVTVVAIRLEGGR